VVRRRVQPALRELPPVHHITRIPSSPAVQRRPVAGHGHDHEGSARPVERADEPAPVPADRHRPTAATAGVGAVPHRQGRYVRQRVRVRGGHAVLHPDILNAARDLRAGGGLQGVGEVLPPGIWDLPLELYTWD
jgi:hypothetical protein